MKLSAILIGVVLLVLFGVCSVQTFAQIEFLGVTFNLENPLYLVGDITLVAVFGYALTIRIIILILAVIVLAIGVLGK